MRKHLTLFAALVAVVCSASALWGQGSCRDDVAMTQGVVSGSTVLMPAPSATIRVCTAGATGTPCLPLETIYTDDTLTTTTTNPFSADGNGNFRVCHAPGKVYLQETYNSSTATQPFYLIPVGSAGTMTSLTAQVINSTVNVVCPACSDWGAAITAAMATCPTGFGGFKSCRVVMPQVSAGPWTTNVTVSNPNIALVGQGKMATNFSCTYNGDCLTFLPSTFTVAPGNEVSGFSIVGNGGSAQTTLHIQDTISRNFHNLFMDGASGAGGSCVWLEAYQKWSERNILDIDTGSGCTKSWRFSANASNPGCPTTASCSLGYNRIYARMNPNTPAQIGMSWEGNLYFYEGELHTVINKDGGTCGATVFKLTGNAMLYAEAGFVVGEDNSVSACGKVWDAGAATTVNFAAGYVYFPSTAPSTIATSNFVLPLGAYMTVQGSPASMVRNNLSEFDPIYATNPNFLIYGGTNPLIQFDSSRYIQYSPGSGYFTIHNAGGDSLIVDNGGSVNCLNNCIATNNLIGTGAIANVYTRFIANSGTGTTNQLLAKLNASGQILTVSTSDTATPAYIVYGGGGTTGNATVALGGKALCTFDAGGATALHYVGVSSTVAGNCKDLGATVPASGVWVVGIAAATVSGGANGYVDVSSAFWAPSPSVLVAALVTTAATSNTVTVTGMTSSGHCSLQPTNAAAATNIATTYVSAKTTNQITVTHVATASMNYDVMCTPY